MASQRNARALYLTWEVWKEAGVTSTRMANSQRWSTTTTILFRPTRQKNEWLVSRGRWFSRLLSNGMAMSKRFTPSHHCRRVSRLLGFGAVRRERAILAKRQGEPDGRYQLSRRFSCWSLINSKTEIPNNATAHRVSTSPRHLSLVPEIGQCDRVRLTAPSYLSHMTKLFHFANDEGVREWHTVDMD